MAVLSHSDMVKNNVLRLLAVSSSACMGGASTAFVNAMSSDLGQAAYRSVGGTTMTSTADSTTVTCRLDVDDRIGFLVGWCATASTGVYTDHYVTVSQGTQNGAWRRDYGSQTIYMHASDYSDTGCVTTKMMIGPFESAMYAMKATSTDPGVGIGENYITITLSTFSTLQTGKANILAFRWPDVSYST